MRRIRLAQGPFAGPYSAHVVNPVLGLTAFADGIVMAEWTNAGFAQGPAWRQDAGMVEIAGPRLSAGFDDSLPLMQELLRRMATGGAHPPLEDSPTLRRLRDGVVQDYALILDRPEATAHRDDKKAITGALIRQPQIFWAYQAPEEIRDQVWNGLWRQLSDLGFPPPEGRQDSLSPKAAP